MYSRSAGINLVVVAKLGFEVLRESEAETVKLTFDVSRILDLVTVATG